MSSRRVNISSGSEFEALVGYSRAVRTGNNVAVSGTTAAGGNIAEQTRNVLQRIHKALLEVGADDALSTAATAAGHIHAKAPAAQVLSRRPAAVAA